MPSAFYNGLSTSEQESEPKHGKQTVDADTSWYCLCDKEHLL